MSNQGGQAVLEYVLILVVVVGILLGGLYQLNTAFKAWAQSYFGDYLSCLLETGELPALGGTVGAAAAACNEMYEPFSIDKGRPLITTGGGGGGGGGGGSSNPNSSLSNQNKAGSDSSQSSKSSSASQRGVQEGSGGSSGSSRVNGSSRFSAGKSFGGSDSASGGRRSAGSGGDAYTGSTESSIPSSLLDSGGTTRIRMKPSANGLSMDYFMDRQERKPIRVSDGVSKSEDLTLVRDRKKAAPMRAPASKAKVEEDSGMTFGSFLRYLVIAAIIIAVVLVVGGQLFQISKGSGGD